MHFVDNFFEVHPTKGYFLLPSATECRPIRGKLKWTLRLRALATVRAGEVEAPQGGDPIRAVVTP